MASCTFSSLLDLDAWRDEAAAILEREILAQTYQDGCNREHAFAYHLFVTQFFVVCLAVARKAGISFSRDYVARLREMIDFAISIMAASHSMPKLGDSDDAYVLDLGDRNDDFDALLAQYAFVSNDALPGSLRRVPECAYWLGGQPLIERLRAEMEKPKPTALLESRGFEASGYYLLQNPEGADAPAMSVLADCAELGFGSIAAHGHADALSFVLRAFGRDVLVDSGTYDYFTYPEWRRYFKSTAAHNTIRIDGQNQSEVLGPFLWGKRARVDVVEWSKADDRIELKARHDGYTQLRNPVTHTRTFLLEPNKLCVTDELDGNGARDVEIFFHFAPDWVVELDEQGVVEARHGACRVELRIDSRLTCECVIGDEKRPAGWFSAGYHQKVPTATVIGTGRPRCQLSSPRRFTARKAAMSKFLLTLDYELFFGPQHGTADRSLLEPTDALAAAVERHGHRLTLFVDATYLVRAREESARFPTVHRDYARVTEQLKSLAGRGHDIQLHVHPHWHDTKFNGTSWEIDTRRYRLNDFESSEIDDIVLTGATLLAELKQDRVFAYRAGGWCMQPAERILSALKKAGVWMDSTVYRGGYSEIPGREYDFRTAPYDSSHWRFADDPLRPDSLGDFVELPISACRYSVSVFWKLALRKLRAEQQERPFGDGVVMRASTGYYLRRLLRATWSPVSIDSHKAALLEKSTEQPAGGAHPRFQHYGPPEVRDAGGRAVAG